MKTYPTPSAATPVPAPELIKQVRRSTACFPEPLPGERGHDYLYLPLKAPGAEVSRPKELGRPLW